MKLEVKLPPILRDRKAQLLRGPLAHKKVGTVGTSATGECQPPIPTGAILYAPRYDGAGKPLASVPCCWCCRTPWKLDRLHEWKGKLYAWLKPGCGCLDVPQALACRGLCVEHCHCDQRAEAIKENETCCHCAGTGKCGCITCGPAGGVCVPCKTRTTSISAQKLSKGDFGTPTSN